MSTIHRTLGPSSNPDTELVLALAGAVGSELGLVADSIEALAKGFDYRVVQVSVSEIIRREFKPAWNPSSEHERIRTLMECGTKFRQESGRADIFALAVAAEIAKSRRPDKRKVPKSR